jgi:serine/threonine-protein kinase
VLFDRIGRGGMADIYLARADTSLGGSRLCVVKQILPELGKDAAFERLLIEEAKLAGRLAHANVVQVFDLGREADRLFIGMEYVEGFDLNQLLRALSKARVPLPAEFAVFIVREVLRALDYAHRLKDDKGEPLGLVHRDVSPSNVLVSFEAEVKLCDFGIARALGAHAEEPFGAIVSANKVLGKSAYMAPEHARGEPIDMRADVFAAGILLWELAAGRRLYKGTEEEMLAQAKQAKVPPLPDRGLPQQQKLQAVLDKALARFRDDRFQNAADFLRALEDYAIETRLMASQLRFSSFLTDHFAAEILALRRERERSARALPSQIPPAKFPSTPASGAMGLADDPDTLQTDGAPPRDLSEKNAAEALQSVRRIWNEPGATQAPAQSLDSRVIALTELGSDSPQPPSEALQQGVQDVDLERSLMGLSLLAEETNAEAAQRASSTPPPQTPLASQTPPVESSGREWLWYVAALLILALGVVGYLWQ